MLRSSIKLALVLWSALGATGSVNLTQTFGPSLSSGSSIAQASDPQYSSDSAPRWSIWHQPTFYGAIKPATESDVEAIVRIATNHSIPFLAVSTGHGYAQDLNTDYNNVLQINLDAFTSVKVNANANTMTIGGATTFGPVIDALAAAGKQVPTGNAACVGMVGATVGAGVGYLQGLHGLILDSLVSVNIVVASGRLLTASATQNSDLFAAVRGAGANFGIITSATYKIYDATNGGKSVNADFQFAPTSNASVFKFFQSLDNYIPAPLSAQLSMGFNQTSKQPTLVVNLIYFGTQAQAQPYINQLTAIKPLRSNVSTVSYDQIDGAEFFGGAGAACIDGAYRNLYSIGIKQTDIPTWQSFYSSLAAFSLANPTYTGALSVQRWSNVKSLSLAGNGSLYPWRQIKSQLLFTNVYPNSSLDNAVDTFMRSSRQRFQATSGFNELEVYINYSHGDEGAQVWYGPSLPRLQQLKKAWDPTNQFKGGHPIKAPTAKRSIALG